MRQLAIRKLPEIDELIERATAVRHLLDICSTCECESIADCRLLTDPLGRPRDQPGALALKRRLVGPPAVK